MFYPVMGKLGRELQWFVSKIFLLSLFWWAFLSMISTRPWMSNWYICSKNKVDKSSNNWFINFSVLQLVPNFSLTTDFDFPILFLPIQKPLTFFFYTHDYVFSKIFMSQISKIWLPLLSSHQNYPCWCPLLSNSMDLPQISLVSGIYLWQIHPCYILSHFLRVLLF